MLKSIYINNFAIIDELELDFFTGMSVLTGETGAGKSVIMQALMLALGARADAQMIRPNAAQCEISATFKSELGKISARVKSELGEISARVKSEQAEIRARVKSVLGEISARVKSVQGRNHSYVKSAQG